MNALFEEKQRINQWWLWLIVGATTLGVNVVMITGVITQIFQGQSWGTKPMTDEALIISSLVTISVSVLVVLMFLAMTLELKVDRHSIQYRYSPLIRQWRRIDKESIVDYRVTKYSYRGYGIHRSFNGTKTLNVRGNVGLHLELSDGAKLVIGTQMPDALRTALSKMMDRTPG